jgi:hypothetical protein
LEAAAFGAAAFDAVAFGAAALGAAAFDAVAFGAAAFDAVAFGAAAFDAEAFGAAAFDAEAFDAAGAFGAADALRVLSAAVVRFPLARDPVASRVSAAWDAAARVASSEGPPPRARRLMRLGRVAGRPPSTPSDCLVFLPFEPASAMSAEVYLAARANCRYFPLTGQSCG